MWTRYSVKQGYTIETNLDTGVAHQTCSDNFAQAGGADASEAYETYSDGKTVRQYDNLARTVQTLYPVEKRRTLAEEWPGVEDRYYIDENGEPHYRYRSNPTNADMAGECLFPQVSAFAYLMDKERVTRNCPDKGARFPARNTEIWVYRQTAAPLCKGGLAFCAGK